MYVVLAEDPSDSETIAVIVKRHLCNDRLAVRTPSGIRGSNLLRKGLKIVAALNPANVTKIIICHDADANDPAAIHRKCYDGIVRHSAPHLRFVIAIPIQEIEAWLLADEVAISRVIPSIHLPASVSPELIDRPKEFLERQSRRQNPRPLYIHAVHNPRVANFLRHELVGKKCPSFRRFLDQLDADESCPSAY